jgi:ADP-heptose:LPS heptosyltransferase
LLHGRPGPVDRVVEVPPGGGVRGAGDAPDDGSIERFVDAMRAERFDLALQMHGGGRHSNPFVLGLGARVTAGMRTPDAAPLDRWIPYHYLQNEVLRYLEVVALVGARPVTLEPSLSVLADDVAEADGALPRTGSPVVALNPGAGDPRRRWRPERFAAVADRLAELGHTIVLVGSADDTTRTGAIAASMSAPAVDLAGRLSLRGLLGLFRRCRVVVSNDSGPLHLARAVGAPTVGIYIGANAVNGGPTFTARHRMLVAWSLECPVCGMRNTDRRCEHDVPFVDEIGVDDVAGAAVELLGECG